jgi:hypothetical protein
MAMNEAAAISSIASFFDSMKTSEKTNTEIATAIVSAIATMNRSATLSIPALGILDSLAAPCTGQSTTGTIS